MVGRIEMQADQQEGAELGVEPGVVQVEVLALDAVEHPQQADDSSSTAVMP